VQVLIDSGNSNLELPSDFATAYNDLWGVNSNGLVDCSAVPAGLWIGVGGGFLYINLVDLIVSNGDGTYSSAVLPVPAGGPYWLGDPFLKNVVALFDWGNQAME
jgi:Eukaryotic aspartyl protease